jgi:tetratricopeptide (TPR) repeat protein
MSKKASKGAGRPPKARPPRVLHCTSEPLRFFGRCAELALLDRALDGGPESVVALVGPGGQGKTAIVQHWLEGVRGRDPAPDGLFFWSFYRGKDADLCLRELYAYAMGTGVADVSASYCVDHLLPILRRERWAVVLDGAEVAQHEAGPWAGRFLHPELGRLLEELASELAPGVLVLTTRFELPTLVRRRCARLVALGGLDPDSARGLLDSLGVTGTTEQLDAVVTAGGCHAKAVELLGTYLAHFQGGDAGRLDELPQGLADPGASDDELRVARVLFAHQRALPAEAQDVLALSTAFRDPPAEDRLLDYLASAPVRGLLHDTWGRTYPPFADRPAGWLGRQIDELVRLRLLERVGRAGIGSERVIDAHPLVRRGFEQALGPADRRAGAGTRAGFLRGRPDRRRADTLEQAREEVELFHACCDAGLFNEADAALVALENPKHRFLAPALERDLLLRFFPAGDWRRPPLWPGFGRWRSLAICFELLGQYQDALAAYRPADAPLRGDALLALGQLAPLLDTPQVPAPWQALWQAYRCHALALAGRMEQAVAVARSLVPVDVYEWVHVFECLLRAGQLGLLDLGSVLFRPPQAREQRWADLARRRMRADHGRITASSDDLAGEYEDLLEAYDRGGLPYERALTRLGYAALLLQRGAFSTAAPINAATLELARQYDLRVLEADAWHHAGRIAAAQGQPDQARRAAREEARLRDAVGYRGPARP